MHAVLRTGASLWAHADDGQRRQSVASARESPARISARELKPVRSTAHRQTHACAGLVGVTPAGSDTTGAFAHCALDRWQACARDGRKIDARRALRRRARQRALRRAGVPLPRAV